MSKEIEKELGIYENIYPTGEKDRYGQCICHAKCKVCNTEVYKPIDRIRKYHSICNHIDKSEIDDIWIYTKIHESGKKNKSGHKLYFYSNPSRNDKNQRMEIDFLISKKKVTSRHNISPIEVKSGKRYTLSSINKFRSQFGEQLDVAYVIHTNDYKEEDGIIYLPVYMTPLL